MEDDILIENYLKGLLSKDEEKSFLDRLNSDTDFSETFKLEEQLFNALNEDSWSFVEPNNPEANDYAELLRGDDLQNLKKTLGETNTKVNSNKGGSSRLLFYYLAAASVVLFLGFQFFFNQTASNLDLYNDYVALNDLPSLVSRSNENTELAKAQGLFENKKYKEALVIFEDHTEQSENLGSILIYQGLSQVELGKVKEAEETYNTLINSTLIDAEKGYWYKALLYLKIDRIVEAKQLLNEIVSKSLYNHQQANKLLSDL